MMKQDVTINNKTGIHARPASDLLKICASYPCNVEIISRGKTYNAKHIMGILMAEMSKGTEVEIQTEGEREEEALTEIISFISNLKD